MTGKEHTLTRIRFNGTLTGFSTMTPKEGGKPYSMEVTLEDGTKAYTLAASTYPEIDKSLRSPETIDWMEWGNATGREVSGEYINWKGMKVIVKLDDPY